MVHAVVCSAGMINSSSAAVSRRVNVASNAFLPITRIPRRRCMLVTATAAPQMQQQSKSPFSMVQSEADLFNILKMGQSKGQVCTVETHSCCRERQLFFADVLYCRQRLFFFL